MARVWQPSKKHCSGMGRLVEAHAKLGGEWQLRGIARHLPAVNGDEVGRDAGVDLDRPHIILNYFQNQSI